MSPHKLLPLVALGLNLLLLGSALAPDRRGATNRVFVWFAAGLAVWNLGVFGLRSASGAESAMWWEVFLHVGVVTLPAVFYHYVLAFLGKRRDWLLATGYAACAVFLAAIATPLMLRGVVETDWGFAPVAGPLYPVFLAYFNIFLILGLARLLHARATLTSSFMRNRIELVVLGVTVSLLGGAVDFARFVFHWQWLYPLGIPSNAVFGTALGVAVLRYRLMDVRLLAKRVIVYCLMAVALSPALFAALWGLALLGVVGPAAESTAAWDALVLVVLVTVALPVLRWLEEGLDRLMFRRQRGVRDALLALSHELPGLLDRSRLAERLTTELVTSIPALHAAVHVWEPEARAFVRLSYARNDAADTEPEPNELPAAVATWLDMTRSTLAVEEAVFLGNAPPAVQQAVATLTRARAALLVPLWLDDRLAAVLTVGEKLSGEIYGTDEVELLEMLVEEAGVALRNAGLYADLRTQMEELKRTQEQLMQSAKLAAIGELSASIAHEINNPLMVILGSAGLLRRQPGTAAERLATIEAQAMRAGNIIRGLLDFARRRERAPEQLAIREVIERSLSLVEGKLGAQHIEVVTAFDESAPHVSGDRDELTQVFINLVSNAADAMPDGGRITVTTEVRCQHGVAYLAVRVADTGAGIPAEHLAQVFEPFFTTKPEGKGTGLGLSVTLGIVKKHEGTIEVDSATGRGTTIVVNLPLTLSADAVLS